MIEDEPRDIRERRLRMRSWRRGTKEMDLILGPYADAMLPKLGTEEIGRFEALLGEDDQSLYRWVSFPQEAPPAYRDVLAALRSFHRI